MAVFSLDRALCAGMPPFFGASDADIFAMILDGYVDFETEPWPSISDEAKGEGGRSMSAMEFCFS